MKIALCVGHTKKSPGAIFPDTRVSENTFNTRVWERLHDMPGVDFYVRGRSTPGMIRVINSIGYDLALDLHFNACSDKTIQRPEVLYWPGSVKGKAYADIIAEVWPKTKTKPQSVSWNNKPLVFLRDTECPALILEPFYATGPSASTLFTVDAVTNMVRLAIEHLQENSQIC